MTSFTAQRYLLMTIPGVQQRTAEVLIAEIGVDMSAFPTPKHLASWAGVCPGNHESGGKRRSGKTRKYSSGSEPHSPKRPWPPPKPRTPTSPPNTNACAGRRGPAKAVAAVGHSILTAAWHMLQTGELYRDLGGDYYTRQNPDRTTKRLVRQLEALGHRVTLQPQEVAA